MSKVSKIDSEPERVEFDIRVRHQVTVKSRLENGEYVDGGMLADALREIRNEPISSEVLEYICKFLDGSVSKPRGRTPTPAFEVQRHRMILRGFYRRYLAWLKSRNEHYGNLDGWPQIRGADFWQGPPNERAARMVARRLSYGAESWRTVQNQISSQK